MKSLLALISILLAVLLLSSCNIPSSSPTQAVDLQGTAVALTLSALQTAAAQPVVVNTDTPSVTVSETTSPQPASTPQNPLVVKDSLCWEGPGAQYEVVSAVFKDTRVVLLGRGSIGSWWIIDNPRYHDPCWVMADVLEFDPGYNLSGLKVFNPPPTPTFTPTNTPIPTATYTPTP